MSFRDALKQFFGMAKQIERIYQLIDDSIAKVVVLKLLGKKIGFSSLYNRMQAIGNQNRLGN
ncbi:hypothetical protein Goari_027241 [Gossypium aridum]|uniref:Uncharacterized protein n=1 Tax=Gossypium aridum TaxID=34290 RepID=A0A7J8YNS2_GOSAI|nr:hypothetical protein [Gossypium aridum]